MGHRNLPEGGSVSHGVGGRSGGRPREPGEPVESREPREPVKSRDGSRRDSA
jgi:hypothetical protein